MTLQLFLNDLSFPDDECTSAVAADRLRSLVNTLRALEKVSHRRLLNSRIPFAAISFGRGFPLAALRNDATSADDRVLLKTLADRSPWDSALAMRPTEEAGGAEYRMPEDAPIHGDVEAIALGLAHELNGLAISMATHELWEAPAVGVNQVKLSGKGELTCERVLVRNASCTAHVRSRADDLRAAGKLTVHDGTELWARRAEILPNLAFVPTTRQQVEQLPHGDLNLDGAVECLAGIDAAIGVWKLDGTARPVYPFTVVPESRSRIEEGLVNIKDADGYVRIFSDHARYGPDENRIHFILETKPVRRALVGHVGRKRGIG